MSVSDRPWLWWMVFDTTGIFTAQPFHDPRKNHWNQTLHSKRHKDASPVSWGKANIIQDILWPSLCHWDWQSNDISLSPFWTVGILNGDKVWKDAGRLPCFPLSIFDLGGGSILIWTARFLPVVLSMESTTYVHHNFTSYCNFFRCGHFADDLLTRFGFEPGRNLHLYNKKCLHCQNLADCAPPK